MKRLLYLRADGNAVIGTGHVMRCLSLAQALQQQGCVCQFVSADNTMRSIVEKSGFTYHTLGGDWKHIEGEVSAFSSLLHENNPAFVVIDTYYVTKNYLKSIQMQVPVVYIDDLNAFDYPVEWVINYNLYGTEILYTTPKKSLLGAQYAPLRSEFENQSYTMHQEVKNVLLLTGGGDSFQVAPKLLHIMLREVVLQKLCFHVVVGALSNSFQALQEICKQHKNVVIHQNVQNMASLMHGCDVAITAGGSTLYELCACGVPSITFSFADNQVPGVTAFAQEKLFAYAGDMRENRTHTLQNSVLLTRELTENFVLRSEISKKIQSKVDGNGAQRLAQKLIGDLL